MNEKNVSFFVEFTSFGFQLFYIKVGHDLMTDKWVNECLTKNFEHMFLPSLVRSFGESSTEKKSSHPSYVLRGSIQLNTK